MQPGEEVRVKILEIDEERRRISLSIKRVGEGGLPLRDAFQAAQAGTEQPASGAEPELGLSDEVFAEPAPSGGVEITDADLAAAHAEVAAEQAAAEADAEPAAEAEAAAEPEAATEVEADAPAEETAEPESEAPAESGDADAEAPEQPVAEAATDDPDPEASEADDS